MKVNLNHVSILGKFNTSPSMQPHQFQHDELSYVLGYSQISVTGKNSCNLAKNMTSPGLLTPVIPMKDLHSASVFQSRDEHAEAF